MRRIWKYQLGIVEQQTLELPQGARPLSVAVQREDQRLGYTEHLCLWVLLDPEEPQKWTYRIWICGTGNPVPYSEEKIASFIGTVQMGAFVWHVFVDIL